VATLHPWTVANNERRRAAKSLDVPGDISLQKFSLSPLLSPAGSNVYIANVGLIPRAPRFWNFFQQVGASVTVLTAKHAERTDGTGP